MNLGDQRDLFEIPEGISYLNCAYMGPQLCSAREIGERAGGRKSRPGGVTAGGVFGGVGGARERPHVCARRESGERAVGRKSRPWEITPGDFFDEVEESRELFARLVGGEADGVAVLPSVSYGMAGGGPRGAVRGG